ncbi:MAG: ATP-dependent 6-phosphofructokinase [Nitrososphaeria archaeon]|jgi:6-phosphofructokinase 1
MTKTTVGIITPGGDAPGMNAAIRCCVRSLLANDVKVIGIKRGYRGLLENDFEHLTSRSVGGIINLGGTILKTARCEEIKSSEGIELAAKNLNEIGLDHLIAIGGDGTFRAAEQISRKSDVSTVCIPASIDNDILGTEETIGFDTAVNTALEAIDKIRDTAISLERLFVVEVMGRGSGFIAVTVGFAAGAEFILIPEIPFKLSDLAKEYNKMKNMGKVSTIIVMAEGAANGYFLAEELKSVIDAEVRFSSLGYIQRGGSPTVRSRVLATLFGSKAVESLLDSKKNVMVGIDNGEICTRTLTGGKRVLSEKDITMLKIAKDLAI